MGKEGDAPLVLIINDIPSIIRLLELELGMQGFRTAGCEVGDDTLGVIDELKPDAIILEILLPGTNGLDMLEEIKKRHDVPVLILTTVDSDADRAQAYDLGADDFVRKPFDPEELGRRVATLIGGGPQEKHSFKIGDLSIELTRKVARRGGVTFSLTLNEWAALMGLASRPGETLSLAELGQLVGGPYSVSHPEAVLHVINMLRRNIEADPENPRIIVGSLDEGFRLAVDVDIST